MIVNKDPTFAVCRERLKHGFTLIEMLVVLAMVLAISMAIVPRTLEWFATRQLQHAAQDVVLAIGTTRSRAATQGVRCHLEFELGGSSYRSVSDLANSQQSPWMTLSSGAVFLSADIPTQWTTAPTKDSSVITFDANGRTAGGQLRIGKDSRVMSISIHPLTGIASWEEEEP